MVQVKDGGCSFDAAAVAATLSQPETFGLFNIRERLESLGGRLEVERTPAGGGCFRMVIPA